LTIIKTIADIRNLHWYKLFTYKSTAYRQICCVA